jgi:hypothetical protein
VSAGARIAAFTAALAFLFAGAALAGGAIEPHGETPAADDDDRVGHTSSAPSGESSPEAHGGAPGAQPVRGLAVAAGDLRVVVDDPELRSGRTDRLRFRIVDEAGRTVRDFDVAHEKRMHLIVTRRDLTGFQHLHPTQASDGSWSAPLRVDDAGSYRMFADFSHEGTPQTLATDLRVDGGADLRPLPEPRATAVSDGGYDVHLDAGRAHPGREAELRFTITRAGVPVPTEPYLGAGGHLVALREGDLAFLHVHAIEHGDGEQGTAGAHDDSIAFAATFPTAGRYRLFLQFRHESRVQTVGFTQEIAR